MLLDQLSHEVKEPFDPSQNLQRHHPHSPHRREWCSSLSGIGDSLQRLALLYAYQKVL